MAIQECLISVVNSCHWSTLWIWKQQICGMFAKAWIQSSHCCCSIPTLESKMLTYEDEERSGSEPSLGLQWYFFHGGNIWKWHAFQWERPSRQRVIQSHLQKAQAIPNICMESAQMSDPISRISLGCSLIPNCRWNWSQMVIYKYPRKWDGWLGN